MTAKAVLALAIVTAVSYGIRELGSVLRQRSALRSLERLAEHHSSAASLVPGVVEAATPGRTQRPMSPWRRQ